ncbi:hypothetical protein [Aquimarina rubra]|uniref:Lipocalin-like domain-containing protein n=1 Tax=Aquimarina rubra TaxID=1920033 RepID=A0ABW5LDB3_9FLAO
MNKKILLNLNILTFTILFFSFHGKAQKMKNLENVYKTELENGTWITDRILGLDPNIKQYNLTKFIERKFAGNLTSFGDKMIFNSSYVAPCGNDNFTTVIGKYEFFDKEKIIISVDSVTYSGEWEKPTEYRKPKKIIFLLSKVDETIVFTKQIDKKN